jgi:hypothetical protein
MIIRPPARRRGGATTVEVAVVISVFLLFLFGIFEYCRFILMLHAVTNACRDGSRYAVVNIDKPTNFDTRAYQDATTRVYPSVVQYTRERLSGVDKMIVSPTPTQYQKPDGTLAGTAQCRIEVYPCDPAQLNVSPPTVPVVAPKPSYASWNDAVFSERVAVRVSGNYKPVLPNFLLLGNTIPVNIVVTMGSEG